MKRLKGIYQNCNPIDQPEGYYRNAKNILIDESIGAITNEDGNSLSASLPAGHQVIGTILLEDDRVVIFSTDNSTHQISTFDGSTITSIYNNALLNFNTANRIQGDFYIDRYGDTIITWIDGSNPARFLNIDTLPSPITKESLNLFPSISSAPLMTVDAVNDTGGNIKSGMYYIAIAYKHDDETLTNFYDVVGPIPINATSVSDAASFKGTANENTDKSIHLTFQNVDTTYESIQLAVIPNFEGVFGEVQLLPEIPIDSTEYLYTGNESYTLGALEEIQVDDAYYDKPKTIHINDDTIYLGNMEEKQDIGYQKYANNIKVSSAIKTLTNATNGDHDLANSYREPTIVTYDKGFKRGEVYALYISWLLKEGGESKAYHIPGRAAIGSDYDSTGATKAEGTITLDQEDFINAYPNPINPSIPPTFTITYQGNNLTFDMPVNNAEPYVEFTFNGIATSNYEIHIDHDFGDPDIIAGNNPISVTSGDEAYEVVNAIVSRVNGDATLSYTASNETGNVPGPADIVLRLTSKTVSYRNLDTFTFFVPPYSGYPDSLGITLDDNVKDFNPSTLFTDFRTLVETEVNNDLTLGLDATLSGVGTNQIKFISETTGSAGNTDVDFSSTIGTAYINTDPLTLSGGGDGTTTNQRLIANIDGTYRMGFWENENEVYPSNSDWDIHDGTTQVGTLQGANVRHHMFPEASDEAFVSGNDYRILGFQLSEIPLPSAIEDQVVGYKVYYAKRDSQRRVIDQAITIQGRLNDDLIRAQYLNESDPANGSPAPRTYFLHPFFSLTDRKNMSGLTHLKAIGKSVDESSDIAVASITKHFRIKHPSYTTPDPDNLIKEVVAKSYVDSQSTESFIDLGVQGFSYNMDNNRGESKLVVETGTGYSGTNNTYGGSPYHLVDLMSIKSDMYVSFDLQQLNSTNYIHTDLVNRDSNLILGGDTFICTYTFRANKRHDSVNYSALHTIICESEANINYREEGDYIWETFYPAGSLLEVAALGFENGSPLIGWNNTSFSEEVPEVYNYDNYLVYQDNNSRENDIKFPELVSKFNKAPQKFPTRIVRSSTKTGKLDRNFLPDDFIDLSTKRGDLVNIATYNNVLIPHMERAVVQTKGREELKVNDIRAFIGSGDIFSVKPQELIYADAGIGGVKEHYHALSSPYGYSFIDSDSGRMYHLSNDGLKDISDPIRNITRDLDFSDIELGYDPHFERILFSFNSQTWSWSPKIKNFVSQHAYFPDIYFATKKKFYTASGNGLYEHYSGDVGDFYGTVYDSEYEYVDNREPQLSKYAMTLLINSELKDNTDTYQRLKTFNKFQISNSYQDTGLLNITYFADTPDNPYIGNARKTKGVWLINQFRDTSNIPDGTLPANTWQYKKQLEDHYHLVKLVKTNSLIEKIYLFDSDLMFKNSIR